MPLTLFLYHPPLLPLPRWARHGLVIERRNDQPGEHSQRERGAGKLVVGDLKKKMEFCE